MDFIPVYIIGGSRACCFLSVLLALRLAGLDELADLGADTVRSQAYALSIWASRDGLSPIWIEDFLETEMVLCSSSTRRCLLISVKLSQERLEVVMHGLIFLLPKIFCQSLSFLYTVPWLEPEILGSIKRIVDLRIDTIQMPLP